MIRLDNNQRTLEVVLAGAIATNQLHVSVGYSDATSTGYNGALQLSLTNSTTAVTICDAPPTLTVRDIDYVSISNKDTAAATVTVRIRNDATTYDQVVATLPAGRQLTYTHAAGWNIGDVNATPVGENPSASVGLAAVNGSALTFMRSDAAPPIDQAIAPTWTQPHTFAGGATLGDASGDALTINSNTVSIPNGVNFSGSNVGIGSAPGTIGTYRVLVLDGAGGAIVDLKQSGVGYGRVVGSSIRMGLDTVSSVPFVWYIAGTDRLTLGTAGHLTPGADNAQTFGTGSLRWSVIYAGTGTINTSDAREKTTVAAMTANEIAAAKALAAEIGTFQFLDAIATKGEQVARRHVGMTVQRAIEIMQAHSLDPMRYGFICYDEWEATAAVEASEDSPGSPARPAGNRYGFRPDELVLFLARGFEARLAALESA